MAINFITSKTLQTGFENMLLKIKHNYLHEHNVIVVPDKFSLNAEQLMFEKLDIKVAFNIEVLSFTKLANIVLEKTLKNKKIINKQISMLILSDVINENIDKFVYFKNVNLIDGFCEAIFNLISQVQTSDFEIASFKQFDEIDKFKDIKLIYEKYLEALKDEKVDASKKFELFIKEVKNSDYIKNSNFFFGMFYTLTPQMLKMTKEICKYSKNLCFSCVNNVTSLNKNLYFNDLYENLIKITKSLNKTYVVEIAKEELKPHFSHLINRFSLSCKTKFNLEDDSIKLVECKDIETEVRNCLSEIKYDLITKKVELNDIAICCTNLEQYSKVLNNQLKKFNLSAFIDEEKKLENLSFIKFVTNLANIVEYENIANYLVLLKSEFVLIDDKNKIEFEDFILKYNFSEKNIFTNLNGFKKDEKYQSFEIVSNEFLLPLKTYIEKQRKCNNSREYFKNFEDFLTSLNVEETLQIMTKKYETTDLLKSKQCSQLLSKVYEIFDNIQIYLEKNFTIKRANYFLKLMFSTNAVLTPPICVDSIFVGDLYNSYFHKYKIIYFLGCTNSNMPKLNIDSSLILEEENEQFNFNLEPKIKDVNRLNKFKCFINLFNATEKIYLSFPKIGNKGLNFISSIMLEIQKLFSKYGEVIKINKSDLDNLQYLKENQIVDYMGLISNNINEIETEYLKAEGNYRNVLLEILKHLDYKDAPCQFVDTTLKVNKLSVSKLEDYFNCPRKFMLKHIVNLRENDSLKLELRTVGNIMHEAIKEFSSKLLIANDKNIVEISSSIFENLVNSEKYFYLKHQPENLILLETLKLEFIKFCKNFYLEQQASQFKNAYNEFAFKGKVGSYTFNGIVDRVDIFEDSFIVIDYKTGSTKFNFGDVYTGKKIQLSLYALFLEEILNKKCAGIFYLNLNDNFKKDIKQQNLMQGVVVNKDNNIYKLDNTIIEEKENLISNYFDFSKKYQINQKEFESLTNYCKNLAENAILKIEAQEFNESPLKVIGQMSDICDYCEFNTICLNKETRNVNTKNIENEMIRIMKNEQD